MNGYKTLIGAIIAAVPTIATLVGFETSPDFEGDATELVAGIITLAGAAFAIYGRLVATAPGWFSKTS